MTAIKRVSLLLAAALIASAVMVSCAEKADDVQVADDNTAVTDEQTETEEELKSNLPDGLNYNGASVRVINQPYFQRDIYTFNPEEETGDIVNDAVYTRNLNVSDQLNIKFDMYDTYLLSGEDTYKLINNFVTAHDDAYEFVHSVQYSIAQHVTSNIYLDLSGLPYIDIDDDWWSTDYIRKASIGSKYYMLTGDITLGHIRHLSCIYFNKQVYENFYGDPNDFYQLVYDGGWTMDKMSDTVSICYSDLNGDGKYDDGDAYGVGVHTSNLTDHFTYDAGIRVTTRNEEGIPQLTMNNENTVIFTEKLYKLFYENEGVHVYQASDDTSYVTLVNKLSNNEVLLLLGWLHSSDYLRDMEVDYGVIPFPKFDEKQETYYTLPHDVSNVVVIPITSSQTEMTAAVLEALAFEGYKNVIPAYYEIALKTKYFRDSDEISNKIIDMIHDNPTTDFAYIYNYALSNVGLIMRDLMGAKSSNFASKYAKSEKSYQRNLDKLIDKFLEIED